MIRVDFSQIVDTVEEAEALHSALLAAAEGQKHGCSILVTQEAGRCGESLPLSMRVTLAGAVSDTHQRAYLKAMRGLKRTEAE